MCILLILILIIIFLHLSNKLSIKITKYLLILLISSPILLLTYAILLTGELDTRLEFKERSIRYYLLLDNEIKNTPTLSNNFVFGYEDDVDWQYEAHFVKFCNIEDINTAKNMLDNYIENIGGVWEKNISSIDIENNISYFSYNITENGCLLFSKNIKK
ncbi:hypothetical protein HYE59_05880 [Aggregatibacter actinomycetemcomitans]|uniref:hypothetical protein n=1 Tax=Aggregatibacter actinomycetemcomitans TaxID=714 RepID=UPI00197B4BA2|nr:hypothetical protein [Aggregatibacter actinomycetemcomitans]MBN6077073.1 hypothetical protein [Aggregatibacter actinomycetemcomitans]